MTLPPSNVKAAAWMSGWLLSMLVLMVAGRAITRELSVFQLMEMRSTIGLVMLYPLIRWNGGFAAMKTARPLLHISRNTVHYAAQYGWFLALTLIPLAQVVAIEFTMPIWTALLAVSFIGERLNAFKILAIALGLVGVVIIVQPGTAQVNPGQLLMLVVAVGFGASVVMIKSLTRTDSGVAITFWMLIIQSAIGLLPALYTWHWPSAHLWPWILVIAFFGSYSHYCMAQAMRFADATVVVPMDFLRVPLSATVGWLLYAERIDLATVAGAALILTGNLLNLKKTRTPLANAKA
ncbi:DMT family transporter [Bradyrhizobium sp. SYSU BS000235]|uniref:DMT family transporter n=1 Tax=Bradyrhizobium sp. SYSU BS000235 TaxID=3411332 RepID=UPI003C75E817